MSHVLGHMRCFLPRGPQPGVHGDQPLQDAAGRAGVPPGGHGLLQRHHRDQPGARHAQGEEPVCYYALCMCSYSLQQRMRERSWLAALAVAPGQRRRPQHCAARAYAPAALVGPLATPQARPNSNLLFVCSEVVSYCCYPGNDKARMVSNAIFRWAAALAPRR